MIRPSTGTPSASPDRVLIRWCRCRHLHRVAALRVLPAVGLMLWSSFGSAATVIDARLSSCDAAVAVPAALEAIDRQIQAEPIQVMSLALVLHVNGRRDAAAFWYYAGLLRARQQLLVEPEKADTQGFILTEGMVGTIIETDAEKNVPRLVRTISDVQAWDARTPNRFIDPIKATGQDAMREKINARFESKKADAIAHRDTMEARARSSEMDDMMSELRARKCGDGAG